MTAKDTYSRNTAPTRTAMEENTTQNSKPNEIPIPSWEAYAMTDVETWEAIEFLLTKLEPVHLEELTPDDRACAICCQEFQVPDDEKLLHVPVKTVCGHIFGKSCIIKWLDPLCYWGLTEDGEPEIHHIDIRRLGDAKTSCPTCRREFFLEPVLEPMDSLASRLWYWDQVYDVAGIARSEKEERSRKHFWEYIEYCRLTNEFIPSRNLAIELLEDAQILLSLFAGRLENQALTPIQDDLRARLESTVEFDVREWALNLEDDIHFPYLFEKRDGDGGGNGEEDESDDGEGDGEEDREDDEKDEREDD